MKDDFGAQLDQMKRGLEDLAGVLFAYRRELLEQGFTQTEALRIVLDYQQHIFSLSNDTDEDPA